MNKWIAALVTGAFISLPAAAADAAKGDELLNHMILSASGDSWSVWNASATVRDDVGVQAGKATRVIASKGANPWDIQAAITLPQPVKKGDVFLVAYYARVETPPAGAATALIPNAGIGLNKAPYTSFAGEAAAFTSKWAVYYTSGVADADYAKGSLNFGVQLAAAAQVVDLGPVFMFNLGPDWDRTKLPHNKMPVVAAAPAAPPASPYDGELAKLRAKLPVKGTLINDPGAIWPYGPDVTTEDIAGPDIPGSKAKHIVVAKAGTNSWDDGAASPVTAAIKKGDVIFAAVLIRAVAPAPGAEAGLISEIGVHQSQAPYTAVATSSATVPKGAWTWVYTSGVAAADYPAGAIGFGLQFGCCQQTLDIGPVFVLNLGPGIDTAKLPNNFGKPF